MTGKVPRDAWPWTIDLYSERDRLKVAFAMFVAKLIVDADGIVDFSELKLLSHVFPDALLSDLGFIDHKGQFTAAYHEAYTRATRELAHRLGPSDKLELITIFHRASWADGELIQAELLVLREAAEVLGVPLRALSEHLAGLSSIAGTVR